MDHYLINFKRMQKTALIIGAGGQDGILLCDLLKTMNYRIVPVFRGQLNMSNKFELEEFMVNIMLDEIYYFASENPSSQDSESLFSKSLYTHLMYPILLFESVLSINNSIRIFYASTSHIFSGANGVKQTENSIHSPDSIYGLTKSCSFQCCKFFREKYGLFISSGILYNHESIYRKESFVSKKIINGLIRILNKEQSKIELGEIDNEIDWGYAPDYVKAMHAILQLDKAEDFIIATGELHTVREFLKIAFDFVGLNYENYIILTPSIITRNHLTRIGDSSKLRYKTKWKQSVSFKTMVETLVKEALFLNNNQL